MDNRSSVEAVYADGTFSGTVDCSSLTEGIHILKSQSYDYCGHLSSIGTVSIFIDNTEPFVTLGNPLICQTSGNITATGSATDNIGLKYVVVSFTGPSNWTGTATLSGLTSEDWSIPTIPLPDGDYIVSVTSYDYANNASVSDTSSISIDTGIPMCEITFPGGDSVVGKIFRIEGTHRDTGGGLSAGVAFIRSVSITE